MADIGLCFDKIGDAPTTLAFFYLVYKADEEGIISFSYAELAKVLGRSRTMVYKYVSRLLQVGAIKRCEHSVNKRLTSGEHSVNKWLTKNECLYVPQITYYKSVTAFPENTRLTSGEQVVNKRLTSGEHSVNKKAPKKTTKERLEDFKISVYLHNDKYRTETLDSFFEYWSQVNEGGTKMLWEKQKAFEISKRLATWKRNEENMRKPTRSNEEIGIILHPIKDKFANEEEF